MIKKDLRKPIIFMIWKKRSKQKWIDVVDPTQAEIKKIQEIFTLDPDAL